MIDSRDLVLLKDLNNIHIITRACQFPDNESLKIFNMGSFRHLSGTRSTCIEYNKCPNGQKNII